MLLISRALVSSSGCGRQSGHQGPPPAPTACHGRVGHHPTELGAGKAASRGCGNISGGAPSAAVQRRKQGPQGCPLQLHPSLPGPPILTVPGSPRPHLTFLAACLRNRVPDTSQTPTAQALGTEPRASVPGWACGCPGAGSTVVPPAAALALGEGVRTGIGGETHPASHLSCPLSSTGLKETEPTGKRGV